MARTILVTAALIPLTAILLVSPFARVIPFLLYFGEFALAQGR